MKLGGAIAITVWVCVGCVGCDQDRTNSGPKAAIDYVVKRARDDLAAITAAIASEKPGDAMYKCAAATANLADLVAGDKTLGDAIDRLCNHDLWARMIEVATLATEKAGKDACYNAELAMGKDELTKGNRMDAAVKAMLARYAAICPE